MSPDTTVMLAMSGGTLWLALILSMVVCLVLGMGLPTVAAYVIAAGVVAPALGQMGVPALAAHLFVLYFSAISTITP
ncbi:MAG: TRAP transporter large permease subunit, partial [Bryobacteraceae bacterium]